MILLVSSIEDLNAVSGEINLQDPSTGNTLVHKAFLKNFSTDLKKAILEKKLDTNIRNNLGQTPIYYAKSIDDVKLLLKYGALITNIDIYGKKAYEINQNVRNFMNTIRVV